MNWVSKPVNWGGQPPPILPLAVIYAGDIEGTTTDFRFMHLYRAIESSDKKKLPR